MSQSARYPILVAYSIALCILNYTFSSLTWHNLPSIVSSPQRRSLYREETLAEVVYLNANTETTEFRPQHMQISQEAKAIAGSVI